MQEFALAHLFHFSVITLTQCVWTICFAGKSVVVFSPSNQLQSLLAKLHTRTETLNLFDFLHQWTLVTAFTHQLHLPANAFSLPVMTMHPMFLSCSASCSATAISAISASQRAFNALGLFSLMTATLHFSPRFSTSKFWNWPASKNSKWNESAE